MKLLGISKDYDLKRTSLLSEEKGRVFFFNESHFEQCWISPEKKVWFLYNNILLNEILYYVHLTSFENFSI